MDSALAIRGSASALAAFVAAGWASNAMPCATTIRSWMMRLGLYALTRPVDRTVPRVWFIDHTIQIGALKLLVILGCPLSQVPFGERALTMKDLSLVALVPMEKSTGDLVERELEIAALRVGRPVQMISDLGSDLQKGIRGYRDVRPGIAQVADVAHEGANLLRHAWEGDARWVEFVAKLEETSSKLRQSKDAYMKAPRLRLKSRFMNIGTQMRFAQKVMELLDSEKPSEKTLKHYGWMRDFRTDLMNWFREHGMVASTEALLRVEGLHQDSLEAVRGSWSELGASARSLQVAVGLLDYVLKYSPTEPGVRYVASTEVLESSIGKWKRIEGPSSQDGITGLSLVMGAAMGSWSDLEIIQALDAVPEKKVENWVDRALGKTVQWLRRQFLGGNDA